MQNHSKQAPTDTTLDVCNLNVALKGRYGTIRVLNDVSFSIGKGGTLGVVGESGCGKSMTLLAIMRLLPSQAAISSGSIRFDGEDIATASEARMRQIRGNRVSMIFQEPMTALNPVFTVGEQIGEALRLHLDISRRAARDRAIELLDAVRIPAPHRCIDDYPHQFSGGMRQRVVIAMAIACEPALILADEPTTALDVTVQAQIFYQLQELQRRLDASMVLVTHDMGVINEMTQRVVVMYGGMSIEAGDTAEIMQNPAHPYTQGLIACLPELGRTSKQSAKVLPEIAGVVPPLHELGAGCPFAARCGKAMPHCFTRTPPATRLGEAHDVACWLYSPLEAAA
ncbi:ABC transporter ATP-binding protein [Mesorhizobium sp. SP-1A]|uniref:ABC transporter ATP-binding protein n=1 Tax=Mesorhizobium sp. SP-1A TaxID=3077840 RepID=UPI0028F6F160|nr:ABC transporter ATP-binding protein [Mesorhizobium sp. SP-1A]